MKQVSRNRFTLLLPALLAVLIPLLAQGDEPAGEKKMQKMDSAVAQVAKFIDKNIADKKINKEVAGWKSRLPKFPSVEFTP